MKPGALRTNITLIGTTWCAPGSVRILDTTVDNSDDGVQAQVELCRSYGEAWSSIVLYCTADDADILSERFADIAAQIRSADNERGT